MRYAEVPSAKRFNLQLRGGFGLEGGLQDRLDQALEGEASGLGGEGEGRGFGETGDGLDVDDPGGAFGEDRVDPGVARAPQSPVGGEGRLLQAGGGLKGHLGWDGEVGRAGGVLRFEVIGAPAGPDLDKPENSRLFAGW